MADIKYRIGVGNEGNDIGVGGVVPPQIPFTADSTVIFADSKIRYADEKII